MLNSTLLKKCLLIGGLSTLLSPSLLADTPQSPLFWMAFKSGGMMKTNYDVKEYLVATQLSDEEIIRMFNDSDRDYGVYSNRKDQWAQARFNTGLRLIAYSTLVRKEATKPGTERVAFTKTERMFGREMETFETRTLKKYLDQRLGIVKARNIFGEELKKLGWPHRENQTNTDIFFDWFNLQKERHKENYRLQEIKKYEYIVSANRHNSRIFIAPKEAFTMAREVETIVEDKIANKRISPTTAASIIESDPRIAVMIKGLEFIGPDSVSLSKLASEAPAVYRDFTKDLEENTLTYLEGEASAKILNYEGLTSTLIEKYESAEKLMKLSDEVKKEFVIGAGDFNHFMLGKLYEMAAFKATAQKENKDYIKAETMNAYATAVTKAASDYIVEGINNNELLGDLRLEDYLINRISEESKSGELASLAGELDLTDYGKSFKVMANWVVKFQVKKASLNTMPLSYVELWDMDTAEGQQRAGRYIEKLKFDKKLADFRQNKLRRYEGLFSFNLTGSYELRDEEAFNFMTEQFSIK